MGCVRSKETGGQSANKYKSNGVDDLNAGGNAAEIMDPRLPLSAKEVFKLKSSWKAVHRATMETGVEMFVQAFRTDPELLSFFKSIMVVDSSSDSDLRQNEKLGEHAEKVMQLLDETILNISDVDKALAMLHKTGKMHRRFEGFHGKMFWSFEKPFLDAVRITLEDRYSDYIATIYEKATKFILGELEKSFDSDAG